LRKNVVGLENRGLHCWQINQKMGEKGPNFLKIGFAVKTVEFLAEIFNFPMITLIFP
jgi:hypothetical protein